MYYSRSSTCTTPGVVHVLLKFEILIYNSFRGGVHVLPFTTHSEEEYTYYHQFCKLRVKIALKA